MSVMITGLGAVSVRGAGQTLAEALRGAPALPPASAGALDLAGHLKAAKTYLDRNSQLSLLAASMALADAGLGHEGEGIDVGISFGTAFGNIDTVETFLAMMRDKGPKLVSPLLFIHSYPNTSSSLIAIEWGLTGPALNFCTGKSAGVDAIIAGAEAVEDGKAQVMLAGAADTDGKLLKGCAGGEGLREGAGMFTMESRQTASEREAVIHAELAGWSRGKDARECMMQALGQAGVRQDEVDLFVLDGAQGPAGIAQEKCLSLNEYIGETLSAGAPLGVVIAAMRIEADAKVRNAVVLTKGINQAALVMKRHEEA